MSNFTPDLSGAFISHGFNLIGQADVTNGISSGINDDLAGTAANPINPHLSPLQMNGGVTPSFALLPASAAIDAGDDGILNPSENLTLDQRGSPRKSGAQVDIGAYEYDGMLNGEVLPPRLTDTSLASGNFQFSFNGASGLTYSVWASTDLLTWTHLGSASEISHGWLVFQDLGGTNRERCFYQIRYP
jgi:hypothetical protein